MKQHHLRRLALSFAAFWLVLGGFAAPARAAVPPDGAGNNQEAPMRNRIHITINGRPFAARLADTDAARAFAALLPLSLDMDDLHGNEKYHHLKTRLPARPEHPGTIRAGDLMLFGDNCVVLFYEDFSTSYSYTRLGRVEHPAGLAEAAGRGAVRAEFRAAGRGDSPEK